MGNLVALCKFYGGPLDGHEQVSPVWHSIHFPKLTECGQQGYIAYNLVKFDEKRNIACYLH